MVPIKKTYKIKQSNIQKLDLYLKKKYGRHEDKRPNERN